MPAVELLIRALSRRDEVTPAEIALLHALPRREKRFAKGEAIVVSHSEPVESSLLESGLAGREILLEDGGRQLCALHVPGDFVDLHSKLVKQMDHGVVALTDCRMSLVPHAALNRLTEEAPHLGRLLWLMTLIDGAIQRQWTVCMGRRDAVKHVAHIICELHLRLGVVGLTEGNRMQLPLSQAVLADVLGMSSVHVNRTLRALRQLNLVSWQRSEVVIHDMDGLIELCGFDETYLNLTRRPR
jgi:CRP-like cAMP-binding protein